MTANKSRQKFPWTHEEHGASMFNHRTQPCNSTHGVLLEAVDQKQTKDHRLDAGLYTIQHRCI